MRQHTVLLILGVLIFQRGIFCEIRVPRVAVIGGGISGASASFFLTDLFNGTVEIDLYEADNRFGGRLANIKIDRNEFEAGGKNIYPKSKYLQKFIKLLGLEKLIFSDSKFGIWDGDEVIYVNWPVMSPINLFPRYGSELYKFLRLLENVKEDFMKIYDLQDAEQSFDNLTALLSAVNKDFPKLLQISTRDYLLHMGFSEKLINEYVQAAIEGMHLQGLEIPIFAVFMTVAVSDGLFSVKCGTKGVPEQLILKNKNINIVPRRVTKIRNLPTTYDSSQYEVNHVNKGIPDSTDTMTSNYDIVIIAMPFTSDQKFQIEFVGFPDNLEFPGHYQTTHVTFVKGDLNLKYFGLQEAVDGILTNNPNKTKISFIEKLGPVDGTIINDPPVWRILSKKSMETCLIHDMFSHIVEERKIAWKAFPRFWTNTNNLNKFKLHDALYHVNAIEWAVSLMELNVIAARNVAILARNDFLQKSYASKHHVDMINSALKPEVVLSESNRKACIEIFRSIRVPKLKDVTEAAVLVPLCLYKGELGFLYTLRSMKLTTNQGQVSFPGGMRDKSDVDLQETALRETWEELKIPKEKIDVWTTGNLIGKSDVNVMPVLAYIGEVVPEMLEINHDEVEEAFVVSLQKLCDPELIRFTTFQQDNYPIITLPCYLGGKHRVWGFTGAITHMALEALVPQVYQFKFFFQLKSLQEKDDSKTKSNRFLNYDTTRSKI